jgi:hypothetical protein
MATPLAGIANFGAAGGVATLAAAGATTEVTVGAALEGGGGFAAVAGAGHSGAHADIDPRIRGKASVRVCFMNRTCVWLFSVR